MNWLLATLSFIMPLLSLILLEHLSLFYSGNEYSVMALNIVRRLELFTTIKWFYRKLISVSGCVF